MPAEIIKQAIAEVDNLRRRPKTLSPSTLDTSANTPGSTSTVANRTADVPLAVRTGRQNPLKYAIPAYESFETDGTGDTQNFGLSHSITDCPYTENIVVWFDDQYQGTPSTVNKGGDWFEVSGPGSVVTVHAFYISDEPATFRIRKSMPSSSTTSSEVLYDASLGLVQQTDLIEQPEWVEANASALQRFVAADMDLSVEVDAPYQVRFESSNGDAEATNALLSVPIQQGADSLDSLKAGVKADMGER
ncbi:hypothetical protein [Haloparvum sedimenti]|uniref:hypothetical protein n=1 Tax=Haloparvum sedimenti TaxID=1678448 RepID=UPI00071E9996|nr:hypothetical protein [Haloparvum sedimenti]